MKDDLVDKVLSGRVAGLGAPRLKVEKVLAGELPSSAIVGPRGTVPHCDSRILHLPEECEYCADRVDLQEERELLEVSNTGHSNRKWPCPADRARSSESLNHWHGNRATTDPEDAIVQAVLDNTEDEGL